MRQKIPEMPTHRRYNPTDEGSAQFAGMRQVDGEMLALLKRDEQIVVLQIDMATVRKLKRLSTGDAVTISRGRVVSKGRSR